MNSVGSYTYRLALPKILYLLVGAVLCSKILPNLTRNSLTKSDVLFFSSQISCISFFCSLWNLSLSWKFSKNCVFFLRTFEILSLNQREGGLGVDKILPEGLGVYNFEKISYSIYGYFFLKNQISWTKFSHNALI